ncbi:MAG: class II aldolase/adducin family protein, partial [Pseudomonadota bacterium]
MLQTAPKPNLTHWDERVDMAAAFRWTVKLNYHEAVANHFSLAVNDDGTQFLMNPNQVHFSRIRASDLLLLDANDPETLNLPGAPDPSAWGLHGSVHRRCPHHRCLMHVHSIFATVLASLADSNILPIDQNTATFFNRYVIDDGFGGLAFEDEGERCATMLGDPKKKVMIMGNHGVLVMGDSVAETFNRLY